MTEFKGMFIDDNPEHSLVYSNILSLLEYPNQSKLLVSAEPVTEFSEMVKKVIDSNVDILFLDYRLDEILVDKCFDNSTSYKGGGLAQFLREKASTITGDSQPTYTFKDIPIVLISSEDNIQRLYEPEQTTHDLFDAVYSKRTIGLEIEQQKFSKKFFSLIVGYKRLAKYVNDNDTNVVLAIFKLKDEDNEGQEIVKKQEIVKPLNKSTLAHVRARFLLKYILRREGVLLSKHELVARLGTTMESFDSMNSVKLTSELEDAKYEGIFAEGWERWWQHKIEDLFFRYEILRPYSLTAEERTSKINAIFDANLKPATSQYTGKTDEKVAFACTCCRKPTEVKHSLSVYDPQIPNFVIKKRVCFACLISNKFKGEIEESEQRIFENLKQSLGKI